MPTPKLSLSLHRESEIPLYRQLINQLSRQIESGALPAGARLPASRSLARQLGISRISVVNAYAELRSAGLLSAHAGRGTFVASQQATASQEPARATPAGAYRAGAMRRMMRLARRAGRHRFQRRFATDRVLPGALSARRHQPRH